MTVMDGGSSRDKHTAAHEHGATIRRALGQLLGEDEGHYDAALSALDALLAENSGYREALESCKDYVSPQHWQDITASLPMPDPGVYVIPGSYPG